MELLNAFLDGVTGAGLFGKLNWPGAPTEFIDSRLTSEFDPSAALRDQSPDFQQTRAPQAITLQPLLHSREHKH